MDIAKSPFPVQHHVADFCVVGGGMAGLCAALAAARHGARVVLLHDRPMLGGNASSEIGVHIIGADRVGQLPHLRETGLLEELRLENLYRNAQASLSVWDLVLYQAALNEPNLMLLLNCSCLDAEMDGARIVSVTGWQTTTQSWQVVAAGLFADCSGDGILAPLTGADVRMGREGCDEYGESIAPKVADDFTMGMSCIFYTREHAQPMPFIAFPWAQTFEHCEELPWGAGDHNFWLYSPWWCELGGEQHSIHDTELTRDELLKLVLGVWDHIKNRCVHSERAANWALERVQFLPGKRESRRYLGPHVLCQKDIEAGGLFTDKVAYGGWTMDDHHPAGFAAAGRGYACTIHHPAPSPYGIPYRSLYSRNISNLYVAGRVASCTHVAMSSTRVMGTCCSMGQAVGTAVMLALQHGVTPAEVDVPSLQQLLLADDAYLPGVAQQIPYLTAHAQLTAISGDPEPVRDGINRQVDEDKHCWIAKPGAWISYQFCDVQEISELTLILDSNMERSIALRGPGWQEAFPEALPKVFRIELLQNDRWQTMLQVGDNYQRFVKIVINRRAAGVRWVLEETWGAAESRVYGFLLHSAEESANHRL